MAFGILRDLVKVIALGFRDCVFNCVLYVSCGLRLCRLWRFSWFSRLIRVHLHTFFNFWFLFGVFSSPELLAIFANQSTLGSSSRETPIIWNSNLTVFGRMSCGYGKKYPQQQQGMWPAHARLCPNLWSHDQLLSQTPWRFRARSTHLLEHACAIIYIWLPGNDSAWLSRKNMRLAQLRHLRWCHLKFGICLGAVRSFAACSKHVDEVPHATDALRIQQLFECWPTCQIFGQAGLAPLHRSLANCCEGDTWRPHPDGKAWPMILQWASKETAQQQFIDSYTDVQWSRETAKTLH